jgi:WD40 repeat protein
MRKWFLSYNSKDLPLALKLEKALLDKDASASVFLAPKDLRAGTYWMPQLATAIAEATCFILLIGEKGLGPWQADEYYEARDRRIPVLLLLLEGQPAPSLAFLQQLHWIVDPDPTSEQCLARLMSAATGATTRPRELWRYAAPYRGLAAMTEADSEFFFGRSAETIETLKTLEANSDRLPVLLGNSGVGKSSIAQAGVLAALSRQAWPEGANISDDWPRAFHDSRRWCFLKLQPGADPLKSLIDTFLSTWKLDPISPDWAKKRAEWLRALLDDGLALSDLLDATERQYDHLQQPRPSAFFLYVDQGEELYARSEERQRRRFSQILSEGLRESRLRALLSMRSDFFGALQDDAALYSVHAQINVPPLREPELRQVVGRPAALLSARFEGDNANEIAKWAAEESAKDAGMLPMLSYLLDDMWTQMVKRGDGVLKLPSKAFELGGVLVKQANDFLAQNPASEEELRKVFTFKLATVREDGEPTRKRALQSEFSGSEWGLVSALASYPYRLLVTITPEGGETYAEVAHEAIFQKWDKLRGWIAAESGFLSWLRELRSDYRHWQEAPKQSRDEALLMGLALKDAKDWLVRRAEDVPQAERQFIALSIEREAEEQERKHAEEIKRRVLRVLAAALVLVVAVTALTIMNWWDATTQRNVALITQSRFLTELASERINANDGGTAVLLLIEALPDERALRWWARWWANISGRGGADRPLSPEAEAALPNARLHLHERKVLGGHDSWVSYAAFSEDGKRLVTASRDKTARIWDVASGRQLKVLEGHGDWVWTAGFSRDGYLVVTASGDKTARIWNTENGAELAKLEHGNSVESASFHPDGKRVVTASDDDKVRIWDWKNKKILHEIPGHAGQLWNASFSPSGDRILTASRDRTARIWNADTGRLEQTFEGHTDSVWTAAFNNDATRVVTASRDATVRIWDVANGKKELVRIDHPDEAVSAYFSPDGLRVITASRDTKVRIWDVATGKEVMTRDGHVGWVLSAAFQPPNGDQIATTSRDWTVRLWDAQANKTISGLEGNAGPVSSAAFSRDGAMVATASQDNTARIWGVDGKAIGALEGHKEAVWSAAFDEKGKRVVTASADKTARIWQIGGDAMPKELKGHTEPVWSAAFSRDGTQVVTASRDMTARVWVLDSGTTYILKDHTDDVLSASFSDDGLRVVTGSRDTDARIWNAKGENSICQLQGHADDVVSAMFSPGSGKLVVTASADQTALIWDVEKCGGTSTLSPWKKLEGHSDAVWSAAFSPDGKRVVTASRDMTARIWEIESGRSIILRGHADWVVSAAFTPDGKSVLTASRDKTVRVWDATSGKEITVRGEARTKAAASAVQDLVEQVKTEVPRCLTREQRSKIFLPPDPPDWCIERGKWPYEGQVWKDWLQFKRDGLRPPLPGTSEWSSWVKARGEQPK